MNNSPSDPNASPFSVVTEAPGQGATAEQLERLYQRYRFSRGHAQVESLLEVACGTGMGLGYLAESARHVTGIDIDPKNCEVARSIYAQDSKVSVKQMDAHALDFPDASFDTALLFEALYYLQDPDRAIGEVRRVLRERGTLIICQVNPDWSDFHRSPYTHRYFSAQDLVSLLQRHFPLVELYGGFPVEKGGFKSNLLSFVKRTALRLHLIPGSLKARAYLKRLFYGRLKPLPGKLFENMAPYAEPAPIALDRPDQQYKILYAVAHAKP